MLKSMMAVSNFVNSLYFDVVTAQMEVPNSAGQGVGVDHRKEK